ncbi:hypothetical protein HBH64_037180 [Parastagonospora nodorum]|nr:hypothetical protein HBH50_168410 [Parastagonospora nodorum]KAH4078144.1 hypothetical protein HBH48_235680 [Parastagonospora nodorum]KAH4308172.1 hypothetical protein HBI01_041620 [Parastagonospora nodorum]KAH4313880.1 hypothetical protein HBI02_069100 [Parastagonospora nodorum]KAH4333750.1 hypothetical protein HBI00_039790 [Parastagonospora nodorum]
MSNWTVFAHEHRVSKRLKKKTGAKTSSKWDHIYSPLTWAAVVPRALLALARRTNYLASRRTYLTTPLVSGLARL